MPAVAIESTVITPLLGSLSSSLLDPPHEFRAWREVPPTQDDKTRH
jgi:hypothetical protein